ncbi:MAG: signal peptide peptidase SppA [Nitrospinae bacterium]|nr:signal peptide peptidase SppA [Nitrospinota bacterium]
MNPIAVLFEALTNALRGLCNLLARFSPAPDFVVMEVSGALPERRLAPRGLQRWLRRRFATTQESLEEWRERLTWLAADPRVKGIVLRIGDLQAGLATLESLRGALERFRASGKRLVAHLPSATLRSYYLASAAERLMAPESAELSLHGLRTEATFLREALDRLGILPQFHHIAEYKSAANPFLYSSMPAPQREMLTSLLDSVFEEMVATIARARQLPVDAVQRAIDQGILSTAEALSRQLIDAAAFEDQLPSVLADDGQPVNIRPWASVKPRLRRPYQWRSLRRQAIGVVQLVGTIGLGESRELPIPLPLVGRQFAGHQTVVRALRLAERLRHIHAIVFHVDSPGGSAVASDLIWHEVARIQQHKPVVVHMGNVAGSGGYYVSCGARYIVAGATTLTGSIGVVAGKLDAQGLYAKGGIHREIITRGETAAMPSPFAAYTETEWGMLRRWMEEIYQRFKERVAVSRGRSIEEVEAVARGRVWTGRQALEHGLVDEIGDLEAAVRQAKTLAGIPLEADLPVVTVRPPKTAALPAPAAAAWEGALRAIVQLLSEQALVIMPPETLL